MVAFNYNTITVHGGLFHADDICCVAMAQIINPEILVKRVFRVEDIAEDEIVCDIGGGKFDHHQAEAELREDGRKYAACGLFFREFGHLLFEDKKEREDFKNSFIIPIENCDNGYEVNPLSVAIGNMNPAWDEDDSNNCLFFKAVDFMKSIIITSIKNAEAKARAEKAVKEALETMDSNGIVVLDQYLPSEKFIETDAKLLIFPCQRGGYNVLTVNTKLGSFENKVSLPENWLKNPPKGCTFVHQARFIATFDTKENAVAGAISIF